MQSARNALLLPDFDQLPFDQQIFALKTAALVCEKTWAQNQQPEKWLRLWGWMTRNSNWPLEIAEFRNYLASGRALPPAAGQQACTVLYGKEEHSRHFGSPFLSQLYNWVCNHPEKFSRPGKNGRFSTFEPWDVPFSFAGCLYFSELEADGKVRIENEREREEQSVYDIARAEALSKNQESAEESVASSPISPTSGLATPPPDLNQA